ncbi:MAG: tetratricopeptide repeat protein [Proteobacteria bacterium]|nr:tetratricopeptide repeat protein [Pseudomonadota bacterium]
MFEYIKKRIIKCLIEEIECLDAIDLELIGHNVISVIEDKKMIHHGINKDYKPSGYTVDSFSNDSAIVGEYSTEKGYFEDASPKDTPSYPKINKDISHAISHKRPDGPDKIYLITNQEEIPSFRSKFNQTPLAQSLGERIIIYDARELAKLIYDQSITNTSYAGIYKQFFPGFSKDLDNYEYYGKIPAQCKNHFTDSRLLQTIRNHYAQGKNICILHGVSGSGKTQATIDFIHQERENFETYIWISGEDWAPNTPLSSIQRTRGGSPINVVGLFNSAKTILVIDSIERNLDETHFTELSGFDKGSRVLATSQISDPNSLHYLAIPTLSKEVALRVLGEDPTSASDACNKFVKACSFSPLILSTARNILEDRGISRDEFYKEVLASPEVISGPDGQSIMRRILAKLEPRQHEALSKIANSGSSIHDLNFLRQFIGVNACINLQRLSILIPSNTPGIMKVHDLICSSAQDALSGTELAIAIEKYIGGYKGDMTPSILRQIHLGYRQIYEEHIRRDHRDPDWLTYSLLQVEGEQKDNIHKKIHDQQISSGHSLASLMCIIDAKEVYSYTIEDREERETYYSQCAEDFKFAFDESSCDDIRAEILHHRAKALRRCGQHEEALKCFSELLVLKPEWHATHGQLAHLGSQYGVSPQIREKGEESLRILFKNIFQDVASVPLRVSLAAIARLRSYKKISSEISSRPDEVKKIGDIIAMSALESFGQFYEAFVSYTSLFWNSNSSFCVDLAEALPDMLALPPELVENKQWVSACEGLTNTANLATQAGKNALSARLTEASIKFADSILKCDKLKSFDARALAKAYTAAGYPQKALEAILKVPEGSIDHWLLYRKVEAQLAAGEKEEALESAQMALDLVNRDPRAKTQIPWYHDQIRKCHEALGDKVSTLLELKIVLETCNDEQYKETLKHHPLLME